MLSASQTIKKTRAIKEKNPNQHIVKVNEENNVKLLEKFSSINKIKTKEELKEHIHKIHNFIRNAGAGYSMYALKIFIFAYSLKLLEPRFSTINISELNTKIKDINDYKFSNIMKKVKECREKKDMKLACEIEDNIKNILEDINSFAEFKLLKYHLNIELPNNLEPMFLPELFMFIDEIPTNHDTNDDKKLADIYDVDLAGKLYEYFIGRDETAIKELGAYFTSRHISRFIMDKINPQLDNNNNNLPTFIDCFGGSGGFTLAFTEKINEQLKINKIDKETFWRTNKPNIYHWDMCEDVVKLCGLEFNVLTNNFPICFATKETKEGQHINFQRVNTFKFEFNGQQFKFIVSNPPYGGDSNDKTQELKNIDFVIEHIHIVLEECFNELSHYDVFMKFIKTKSNGYDKLLKNNEFKYENKNISQYSKLCKSIEQKLKNKAENIFNDNDFIETFTKLNIEINQCLSQLDKLKKNKKEIEKQNKLHCVNYDTCSTTIRNFIDKYKDIYRQKYMKEKNTENPRYNEDYDLSHDTQYCNDKEACSLILFMALLEKGGTAALVLKQGVFTNGIYSFLREILVEHFKVLYIGSLDGNEFENTSVSTKIIIFENPIDPLDTTEYVDFCDVKPTKISENKIIKNDKGEYEVIEIKDQITGVMELNNKRVHKNDIAKPTITKNKKNEDKYSYNYSFDSKIYNKEEIVCGDGYELVKLGDICEFLPKSKRNASFGQKEGKYNFYTSSDKVQKCNVVDYKDECILIGTGGNSSIHLTNNFSCSADNLIIKSNKINNKMIYHSILSNWNMLIDSMHGSTIKHITKEMLKTFSIIIPKSLAKIQEWVDKISKPYDEKNMKTNKIAELELKVQDEIKRIIDEEECDEVELKTLIDTKSGEYLTKRNMQTGIYPVYGGGDVSNYINKYNNENKIIINKDGVSLNCVKFIYGKFFLNHHGWVLIYNNLDNKNYINYWLYTNQHKIYDLASGSAQKGLNKEKFLSLMIKIPKNKTLIQNLEPTFQQIETLQQEVKDANDLYNNLILELANEAIPKTTRLTKNIINNENKIIITKTESIIDNIEPIEVKVSKPKKNAKKAKEESMTI
jgi:hypothetical protein